MANLTKFTRSGLGQILAHVRRGSEPERYPDGNPKKLRKYKNQNIVATHSKYNYNLRERGDNLTDYQYIEKRVKEHNVLKRDNVNWLGSWVVSLPKSLQNANEEDKEMFFKETFQFLSERYGKDNIVYAYVHMDETTPHMHTGVTPCFYDKDKKRLACNYKKFFSRKEYQTFHKDFSKHMKEVFGYDIGVYDDSERKKAFNKTTTELIKEGNKWANKVESLERQAENAERVVDEKTEEAYEWARFARDMQNEAYQSKQLAEQAKQEVIDLKDELEAVKEENLRIRQENEFMSNQWDNASPAEKLGIKRLKVAEEEIKAEVNKRVLEQMKPATELTRRLTSRNKALTNEVNELKSQVIEKNNQMNELFDKWVEADQRSKSLEKEVLGFAERVLDFAPKVFYKALEKASSWFLGMLDRKFNLGLSEEQENAPQRDTKGIER
jgi:hypothetical protein